VVLTWWSRESRASREGVRQLNTTMRCNGGLEGDRGRTEVAGRGYISDGGLGKGIVEKEKGPAGGRESERASDGTGSRERCVM